MRYIFIGVVILVAVLVSVCIKVFRGVAGISLEEDDQQDTESVERTDLVCAICSEKDDCPYGMKRKPSCVQMASATKEQLVTQENQWGYRDLISGVDVIEVGDEWQNSEWSFEIGGSSWYVVTPGNRLVGETFGAGFRPMRRPLKAPANSKAI